MPFAARLAVHAVHRARAWAVDRPRHITHRGNAPNHLPRRPFFALLGIALLVRLFVAYVWLPGGGFPTDLSTFSAWGLYLFEYGPGTFYESVGFADYPPAYLYVLWALGSLSQMVGGTDTIATMQSLIKLPAIFADIAIGALIIAFVARIRGARPDTALVALVAGSLFLFNPLTIYDSALWGQVDSVGLFVLLGALILLTVGATEIALPAMVLAGLIKPQLGLILIPVVVAAVIRRHIVRPGSGPQPTGRLAFLGTQPNLWRLVVGAGFAFTTYAVISIPFGLSPLDLIELAGKAASTYPYMTVNAYNPWALMPGEGQPSLAFGGGWHPDSDVILGGLTAFQVGAVLLASGLALTAAFVAWRDDRRSILLAATFAALVFFVLPTRVHERYLFPITALLPLLAIANRRHLLMLAALSVAALANFHGVLLQYAEGATKALPFGELARDRLVVTVASIVPLIGLIIVALDTRLIRTVGARLGLGHVSDSDADDPLTAPSYLPNLIRAITGRRLGREVSEPSATAALTVSAAATAQEKAAGTARSVGPSRLSRSDGFPLRRALAEMSARVRGPKARSGEHRLDRRDLGLATLFMALAFITRFIGVGQPASMYFDEVYHARTAYEFLQYWRYGQVHDIYEFTHPHLAKYAMAAGSIVFDNNKVVETSMLAPARDALVEPRYEDQGDKDGERLFVATGSSIEAYQLPAREFIGSVAYPAITLSLDAVNHRLLALDAEGGLVSLATDGFADIDLAIIAPVSLTPTPTRVAASDDGTMIWATSGPRTLLRFDALTGEKISETETASDITSFAVLGDDRLAVGLADASLEIYGASLAKLDSIKLSAPAQDLANIEQDGPRIYAATDAGLAFTKIEEAGTLTDPVAIATPGGVRLLEYQPSSGFLHALGNAPSGVGETVYVLDPHGNSVFADAPLPATWASNGEPFEPAFLLADATPAWPGDDPQELIALDDNGALAVIDAGSNATAWRLPGVLMGTILIGALFLLARLLLARRGAAIAVGALALLDGLFFVSARIAMNDIYAVTFIVCAYTLFAALWTGRLRSRWAMGLGLPAVGLLLGLALASKWVGMYAIGGIVLLLLARTRLGRWLIVAGLVGISGTLALTAMSQGNTVFAVVMFALATVTTVLVARREPDLDPESELSWFMRPGLGWAWSLACLAVIPIAVYIGSYAPWVALGNSFFGPLPEGSSFQTLPELTKSMYDYHDQLRATHPGSSPWWAWPFDLKPVWLASDALAGGLRAQVYGLGNLVVFLMAIPALLWAAGAARRRRDLGLAFIVIAFFAAWLPWARIDRVTFAYHYFSALPFAILALGALLGELWSRRPSSWAFIVAKTGAAAALCFPALLWLAKTPLCAVAGATFEAATACKPGSAAPTLLVILGLGALLCIAGAVWLSGRRGVGQVPIALGVGGFIGTAAAIFAARADGDSPFLLPFIALAASGVTASALLSIRQSRTLVYVIVGAAAVWALVLYPFVAGIGIPADLATRLYQILPTYDYYFQFATNSEPAPAGPGLTVMIVITALLAFNVVGLTRLLRRDPPASPDADASVLVIEDDAARS